MTLNTVCVYTRGTRSDLLFRCVCSEITFYFLRALWFFVVGYMEPQAGYCVESALSI